MPPIEPNEEERQQQLPQDGQTPFSPADDEIDESVNDEAAIVTKHLDDTHPSTDTDVQPGGIYEGGIADETGISEPNADNAVLSYDPEAEDDQLKGTS